MRPPQRAIVLTVSVIVALGLALRSVHFVRVDPVWHDEAAALLNVVHKNYAEFWGPRLFNATEPPLALAIVKAASQVLGESLPALRLPAFLAGCVGFVGLAFGFRSLLAPAGWVAIAFLAAFSDRLLFHACEAKPYSFDFTIGVVVLALVAGISESDDIREVWRQRRRRWLAAAALAPLVFLSYPLVFMLAAYGLIQGAVVARSLGRGSAEARAEAIRSLLPFAAFAVVAAGCSLVLVKSTLPAIQTPDVLSIWATEFPNYARPWTVPLQLADKVLQVFRYALNPIGQFLAPFVVLGGVALVRRGRGELVAWACLVFAINAAAWLAGKYPIGHYRVNCYLLPTIFLISSVGVGVAAEALAGRKALAAVFAAAVVVLTLSLAGYRLAKPWPRLDCEPPVRYVLEHRDHDEPVVGTTWEFLFYFRGLGDRLVETPPPIDDSTTPGFWFLGNTRDIGTEFLGDYKASDKWTLASRTEFAHFVVLHFRRAASP